MRTLVLYFSTTGHTKTVATLLAEKLGADLGEIRCPSYHTWLGWPAMARDIFARRRPLIEVPAPVSGDYDLVVLGGSVWAGRPAPPIVSYLTGAGQSQSRYAVFVTCGGTNPKYPPEAALAEIVALASGPVAATCVFSEAQIAADTLRSDVAEFAKRLRQPLAAG
ncbi:MAG TPA: hypothetical protein VL147_02070 [Devosia sp.]|nr:hypothetical protein [Devosia sp.]